MTADQRDIEQLALAEMTEHRYSTDERAYAAAHDLDPAKVDEDDGGFQAMAAILADKEHELLRFLGRHLGILDDSWENLSFGDIGERIDTLRTIDQAAAGYVKTCLCNGGIPELEHTIGEKFTALVDAVRAGPSRRNA